MYQDFFAFKERPFKLVPDPAYYYISHSHEEALAHLHYAVTDGDGFAVFIGEVGTGKTTLCRYFLDNVDETYETAYIFNPKLTPKELLATIVEEFGLHAGSHHAKELIDRLNAHLIEKKAQGKHMVVLIDEAQQLEKKVLELLRLLSNLETHKSKLLQIILVGQPELRDVLESYELRQLDQRINLRWHLTPLKPHEVKGYIEHRIAIASDHSSVSFTNSAFRAIYEYSRGIPRLVNIVCDRSLIMALSQKQKKITKSIVRASILELSGRGHVKRFNRQRTIKLALSISLAALVILVGIGVYQSNMIKKLVSASNPTQPELSPTASIPADQAANGGITAPQEPQTSTAPLQQASGSEQAFTAWLGAIDSVTSRQMALQTVLSGWALNGNIDPSLAAVNDAEAYYRLASRSKGLLVKRMEADLQLIGRLNHPAILEIFSPTRTTPIFVALQQISGDRFYLSGSQLDSPLQIPFDLLQKYYSGTTYIFWKNFLAYRGTIPMTASKESIITLKMHLQDIGFDYLPINAEYDAPTRFAVKQIQRKYGLVEDGIVGSMTKIALYNETKSLEIPRLSKSLNPEGDR